MALGEKEKNLRLADASPKRVCGFELGGSVIWRQTISCLCPESGMGIVGEGSSLNLRKHFCFLLPALGSPTSTLSMLLTSHLCPTPHNALLDNPSHGAGWKLCLQALTDASWSYGVR